MTEKSVRFASAREQAGFTMIPNAVMFDPTLSVGAKMAYGTLIHYARQEESCWPGQDRIATNLGVSERSVRTYLEELTVGGLITSKRRGLGATNVYEIVPLSRAADIAVPERQESAHKEEAEGSLRDQGSRGVQLANKNGRVTRARPRFNGSVIAQETLDLACAVLEEFNRQTDRHLQPFTARGDPSENLRRILGAVLAWPEVTFDEHRRIIAENLAHPWWKGPPSVGAIFSPKAFEDNRDLDSVRQRRCGRNGAEQRVRRLMEEAVELERLGR